MLFFFIWFGIGEGSSSFITPDCTAFWIQSTRWYLPNHNTSRWGRKWNCISNQNRIRSGADKISCWDTGFQLWIYSVSVLGSLICITSCNMGESLTKTRKQKDQYAQKGLVWCKAVREMWSESRSSLAQCRAPADPFAEHGAASAAPGWKEVLVAASSSSLALGAPLFLGPEWSPPVSEPNWQWAAPEGNCSHASQRADRWD